MAIELLMPQLGLTMNEGTITEWAKKEGDSVSKGDILFYVENDKAVIPFEAQNDGVLARILVNPMKTVPVGTVVGMLAAHGETIQLQPEKLRRLLRLKAKQQLPLKFPLLLQNSNPRKNRRPLNQKNPGSDSNCDKTRNETRTEPPFYPRFTIRKKDCHGTRH